MITTENNIFYIFTSFCCSPDFVLFGCPDFISEEVKVKGHQYNYTKNVRKAGEDLSS